LIEGLAGSKAFFIIPSTRNLFTDNNISMMVFNNSVPANSNQFSFWDMVDAYYLCMFTHSIRHLSIIGNFTPESIFTAMQKSFEICQLIGVNAKHHFKKVFVYDAQMGVTSIDWLMSKKGYHLMQSQLKLPKKSKFLINHIGLAT
jgi:hypothetical protein